MKKSVKNFFVFASVAVALPLSLSAQIVITEVMYDLDGSDAGREWIEVENAGTDPVDLSSWRLFEASTNHKINAVATPGLPAGHFAVIADDPAKFKTDNPDFTGLLFDSVFSLGNTGETLVLRDQNMADIDSVAYSSSMGASGDGNSLQKTSSGWISALPTPGKEYTTSGAFSPGTSSPAVSGSATSTRQDAMSDAANIPANYSSHSSQAVASLSYDSPELEVSAGRPRLGFVGVPLSFEARAKPAKDIAPGRAIFSTWSMGDGTQISGQFVSYAYDFPGEYVVILNSESSGTSAVSRTRVKIIEPKVTIGYVGSGYVEVLNNGVYELNLGGWMLETAGGRFVIPRDTIVMPHSSVKLPASVTRLPVPGDFMRITNPKGKILAVKNISNIAGNPIIILPLGMDGERLMAKLKEALKK